MNLELIEWLREDVKTIRAELKAVDGKVDQLLEFKTKVIGGTILASLILTAAFQIMLAFIQKG